MSPFWTIRGYNDLYVCWRGRPIYKRWDSPGHPSVLLNDKWPGTVWIIDEQHDNLVKKKSAS